MPHFITCKCKIPKPNASGRVCSGCNGYIEHKKTFEWFVDDPVIPPITEGDLRFADVRAQVVMEWSDLIVDDVTEEEEPIYTSGWVMKVMAQQIVYKNHNTYYLSSTKKEGSEDPVSFKATQNRIDELLAEFDNGEELYRKSALFHKYIKMMICGLSPYKAVEQIIVMNENFRKEMEDYINRDTRPFLIKTDNES